MRSKAARAPHRASSTTAIGTYTVGVFLQTNFGSRHELTIAGVPIGRELTADNPLDDHFSGRVSGVGSCIGIVATDAPLLPGQCKALARRVPLGRRTGTTGSHFSGDIFLAFSTANRDALNGRFPKGPANAGTYGHMDFIPWGRMDDFYAAVVQATEEAVINALVANEEMVGRDRPSQPCLAARRRRCGADRARRDRSLTVETPGRRSNENPGLGARGFAVRAEQFELRLFHRVELHVPGVAQEDQPDDRATIATTIGYHRP